MEKFAKHSKQLHDYPNQKRRNNVYFVNIRKYITSKIDMKYFLFIQGQLILRVLLNDLRKGNIVAYSVLLQ